LAKRDVLAVAAAVPVASSTRTPLASLSPVSAHLGIRKGRPDTLAEGWLVALPDSKLRLLAPGVSRFSSHVVLETDLSVEQLQEIISPVEPGKPVLTPEEEARRAELRERAKHLAEAYRAKVGEGPEDLERALFNWLNEGIPEDALREAFIATAAAVAVSHIEHPAERYAYLREVIRIRRRSQKPKPKP
jgi:hypothetical protein